MKRKEGIFEIEEDEIEIWVKKGKDFVVIDVQDNGRFEFVILPKEEKMFNPKNVIEFEYEGETQAYVSFNGKDEAIEKAKKYLKKEDCK